MQKKERNISIMKRKREKCKEEITTVPYNPSYSVLLLIPLLHLLLIPCQLLTLE